MKSFTKSLLVSAALAGVAAGTVAKAQSGSTPAPTTDEGKKAKTSKVEKHACKGENSCKGNGGCGATKGKNDCKGKGECRTDGKPMEKTTHVLFYALVLTHVLVLIPILTLVLVPVTTSRSLTSVTASRPPVAPSYHPLPPLATRRTPDSPQDPVPDPRTQSLLGQLRSAQLMHEAARLTDVQAVHGRDNRLQLRRV